MRVARDDVLIKLEAGDKVTKDQTVCLLVRT
jgi:hypothetical protein